MNNNGWICRTSGQYCITLVLNYNHKQKWVSYLAVHAVI